MEIRSFFIAMATSLAAPSAFAGTPSEESTPITASSPAKEWWITVAGDTWLSAVDGEVGIRGLNASADTSIGEVLDHLDFAYMGLIEAGYKRWSIAVDGVYAKLSDDARFHYGPVSGSVSLEQEQAFVTARVQYRLVHSPRETLDVFGGIRWDFIDVDTDVQAAFSFDHPALQRFNREGGRRFDLSDDWVDPIVGFRSVTRLGSASFLQLGGDIGGFGVSSELTWQALAGVGYDFTPRISGLFGYRALGIDYDHNAFKMDTVSHGPVVALAVKF